MNDWYMEIMNYRPTLWERIWWPISRKIDYVRYEIPNGLRGLWHWFPFAWKWRPWDYEDGLLALHHHLVPLEKCVREGISMDREQCARDIRVAIRLIERITDRDFEQGQRLFSGEITGKQALAIGNWESDYLYTLLRRKSRRWWD